MGAQHPGRIESILRALTEVAPSHLLDRKLFDFAKLKPSAPGEMEEGEPWSRAFTERSPPFSSCAARRASGSPCSTAYDFPTAKLVAEAGVDLILVGDSLGMVVLGYDSTVPVTMDDMVHHTRAARARCAAGLARSPTCLSCPTARWSGRSSTAARLMKEAGARFGEARRRQGSRAASSKRWCAPACRCMGHVGLTPQTASALGGYKLQGKDEETRGACSNGAQRARAGRAAGAWCWSWCPRRSPRWSPSASAIPTIGIGAGPQCDGQVLVFHDLVGMFSGFTPTFVKRYTEAGTAIRDAWRNTPRRCAAAPSRRQGQAFPMKDDVLRRRSTAVPVVAPDRANLPVLLHDVAEGKVAYVRPAVAFVIEGAENPGHDDSFALSIWSCWAD